MTLGARFARSTASLPGTSATLPGSGSLCGPRSLDGPHHVQPGLRRSRPPSAPVPQQEQEVGDADITVNVQVGEAAVLRAWSPRREQPQEVVDPDNAVAIDVAELILTHCGLADELPRAPPNAPPPDIRELRYVNDLEFVQDPGPAEPVWSAD